MSYPKTIVLENPKLKKHLLDKKALIDIGRNISTEIEEIEKEMDAADQAILEEEKKVDVSEFKKRQEALIEIVNQATKDMDAVQKEMFAKMKETVPASLYETYDNLKIKKEEKETERNKVAIKAQKYTDKIIPLAQKAMKPYLTERGDDYDTIKVEDDKVIATIFNHFDDFEKLYIKKYSKK